MPSKPNIRTVNKLIGQTFPSYGLIQEKGCVRLHGPDTHTWVASCFMVNRVSDQSPERWLADVADAITQQSTENAG